MRYPGFDNTFSLVARCANTGALAVAVCTARLAVGSRVPFACAGVGAVATQANTNPELGREALVLMQAGATASDALERVLARDTQRATRQLSVIDRHGNHAVFTGADVLDHNPWAGSQTGHNCVAAGNQLMNPETVHSMVRVFETTPGFLGERVLCALEAGQAAGGDKRGKISAAILVVHNMPQPVIDLRVDMHENPVPALRALFNAYQEKR